MKLGVFLSLGSSFKDQKKSGQDIRFIDYYLKKYNKVFNKIYVFSYQKEKIKLPKNCVLIPNKFALDRFLYSFLMPFFNYQTIKKIDVFRVMQLTGSIPAIIGKIFFGKPFVFTFGYNYVSFAKLDGQKIRPLLLKFWEKLVIKFCLGVIVTNKKIKAYLNKKYPKAKLFYIPNGVDIKKFKSLKVKRLKSGALTINHPRQSAGRQSPITPPHRRAGIHHSPITRLLFVGRLEKQKNLANLIKAVSLLNNKYNIKITFIGQGKLKLQLIKLAKKLAVNLKIISSVSYNKMPEVYQQADIFILPSILEGHPKALLEAMASSLPCLISRYPGAEEFKNKKEVLITKTDFKSIVQGLELLIKDKALRKKLSLNARKRIEKDFNIKKLLEKEINFLRMISKIQC